MAAHSAFIKGAGKVIIVDSILTGSRWLGKSAPSRLTIQKDRAVEQIWNSRTGRRRPGAANASATNAMIQAAMRVPNATMNDLVKIGSCHRRHRCGGVFIPADPGSPDKLAKKGSSCSISALLDQGPAHWDRPGERQGLQPLFARPHSC